MPRNSQTNLAGSGTVSDSEFFDTSPITVSVSNKTYPGLYTDYDLILEGLSRSSVSKWHATGRKIDVDIKLESLSKS